MNNAPERLEIKLGKWQVDIGTIEKADLQREDHGIFILDMRFAYGEGGSGQGLGGLCLDGPKEPSNYDNHERVCAPWTGQLIMEIMDMLKVSSFNRLVGRKVLVLRDEGWNGMIRGIATLDGYSKIVFQDWIEAHTEN